MEREAFLARLRHALGRRPSDPVAPPPDPPELRATWDVGDLRDRFSAAAQEAGMKVRLVPDEAAARAAVAEIVTLAGRGTERGTESASERGTGRGAAAGAVRGTGRGEQGGARVALADDAVVERVVAGLDLPIAPNAADAKIGITGAVTAAADVGSVVLSSRAGRRAGLLVEHHVVLLAAEDVRPTLAEALVLATAETGADPGAGDAARGERRAPVSFDGPSALTLVSGPSRSADIELTLTTGVHGPGEVTVIVIGP
ncbi:MAG: LUD domain-containing protein [Trueperaceae bacterium]